MGLFDFFGAERPDAPQFQMPSWAQGLPEEMLQYIRQGVGQQLQQPQEYDIASQQLQQLLGQQQSQFQLPIEAIQKALAAQQQQQYRDWSEQINPILANQGQLDSSYHANLVGRYLQDQQTASLGNTANLLTQQAQENLNTQRWYPQMQAGLAGQLAGVGSQKSDVSRFNITSPYQTYIPAMSGAYGQGMNLAQNQYNAALVPYQQHLQEYNQDKASEAQFWQQLGGAATAAATGGLGGSMGMYGSGIGGGQGALMGLSGISPGQAYSMQNYRYNPWQQYSFQNMGQYQPSYGYGVYK